MSFTIEEFNKLITNDAFKDTLSGLVSSLGDYAYAGFKPQDLFEALVTLKTQGNIPDTTFVSDISLLLGLFHVRGPNTSNLKATNTTRGETAIATIKGILTKYGVVAKAAGKSKAITLPRLSLTFPYLSLNIWGSLKTAKKTNEPVSDNELGLKGTVLLSLNCVPSLLESCENGSGGKAFFIHCLYQSILSYKTEVPKRSDTKTSKQDHFISATKYAYLSFMGSFAVDDQKEIAATYIKNALAEVNEENFLACIKRFFSTLPTTPLDSTPTKYHYLINYLILKNRDVDELMVTDIKKSLEDMKKSFPF